jgi:hypothetical protein
MVYKLSLIDRASVFRLTQEATIPITVRNLLIRHQPDLTSEEIDITIKACLEMMEEFRRADPGYFLKLTAAQSARPTDPDNRAVPDKPSTFVITLAVYVCFPHGLPSDTIPFETDVYTAEHHAKLESVTQELLRELKYGMHPYSTPFRDTRANLRELLSGRLQACLLGMRFKGYKSMFPAPQYDCFLATLPLLTELDVQPDVLDRGLFQRIIRHRGRPTYDRHVTDDHLKWWSMASEHLANVEDRKMIEAHGLTVIEKPLLPITQSMVEMIDLHLTVYKDIYLGKGMLVESGVCTLAEKLENKAKREAANIANKVLTDALPTPKETSPTDCAIQ